MSSPPQTTESGKTQRTLYDAAASHLIHSFPRGVSLRFEPTEQFKAFLKDNRNVRYVVINFKHAETIIKRHGTVHEILEDWQIPIITATDEDGDIYARQQDDIRYVLKHSQPAIYIPDAGTVYWTRSERNQKNGIRFFINRLNFVMEVLETNDWEIGVLPLAKGMKKWHYKMLRDCYERHGFSNYAFYAKQYFGEDRGNCIRKLENHVQNLVDVMNAKNVFMIALLSENYLDRLPPQVTGACGLKQFVDNCKVDGQFSEDYFVDWKNGLETTLLNKPTVIQQ